MDCGFLGFFIPLVGWWNAFELRLRWVSHARVAWEAVSLSRGQPRLPCLVGGAAMPMPPPLHLREEGPKGQGWRGPQAQLKGGTITPPCRNPYSCCLCFQNSSWHPQVLVFLFFLVAISGQPIPIQERIPDPHFVCQNLFVSLPATGFSGVYPHFTRSGNFSGSHTQGLHHQGVKVLPRPLQPPLLHASQPHRAAPLSTLLHIYFLSWFRVWVTWDVHQKTFEINSQLERRPNASYTHIKRQVPPGQETGSE